MADSKNAKSPVLTGRRVIYTDYREITRDNVLEVLSETLSAHYINKHEIEYLDAYYRGNQPILYREKTVRPEVNNKIVVNRASEIVEFKTGYVFGEPVQYVSRTNDGGSVSGLGDKVGRLNDIMRNANKEAVDREIAEWMAVCGVAYRLVLPSEDFSEDEPLTLYSLDPRYTYVVRSTALGTPPVMAVTYVPKVGSGRDKEANEYHIYTAHDYFRVVNNEIVEAAPHILGYIPIIEYSTNRTYIGEFEKVITLLDAINLVYSDRANGIEQFVSALMKLKNADIDEDAFDNLRERGLIKITSKGGADADLEYMVERLDQTDTQVVINDMYAAVLTICGMPNRNGGSSTSDTGSAVILRDGWELAEAYARSTEVRFKKCEREFLKCALNILSDTLPLKMADMDIKFTRRNYENNAQKASVLTTMLACDKIHPRLAFEHCGMFSDVEKAYDLSKQYIEENEAKAAAAEETEEETVGRDITGEISRAVR